MHVAWGETRFVIVTNKYAIKIARIRPLKPFVRIWNHLLGKKVRADLLSFDRKMAKGCVKYILPGIFANRAEAIHWKKHSKDETIVPTLFSFFWLVNIQKAGVPATEGDLSRSVLYQRFGTLEEADMNKVRQYCVIDSKVLLADYGQIEIGDFLSACVISPA